MVNIILISNGSRPRLIDQSIKTLYATTPMERFNLIVIWDGIPNEEDSFGSWNNSRILSVWPPRKVLAHLKTLGAYWSGITFGRGDWLYFSDDDCAFLPGWLGRLTEAAEASESIGFRLWGGQAHPYHHPINEPHLQMANPKSVFTTELREYAMLDGPSWLMRWETWDKIGPLEGNEEGACKGEDVTWCKKLTASGGRIGVIHPHVVIHTGLTNSEGQDAPGRKEREALIPAGIIAE